MNEIKTEVKTIEDITGKVTASELEVKDPEEADILIESNSKDIVPNWIWDGLCLSPVQIEQYQNKLLQENNV